MKRSPVIFHDRVSKMGALNQCEETTRLESSTSTTSRQVGLTFSAHSTCESLPPPNSPRKSMGNSVLPAMALCGAFGGEEAGYAGERHESKTHRRSTTR